MNIKEEYLKVKSKTYPGDISYPATHVREIEFQKTVLWSIICNTYKNLAFKSKKQGNGDNYTGDNFIAVISTDVGDYSFLIDLKYWSLFDIEERDTYEDYDEHKPEDIGRLYDIVEEIQSSAKTSIGISYEDMAKITERNYIDRKDKKPIINPNQFTPENLDDID